MLTISDSSFHALVGDMLIASYMRTVAYLRESAPDHVKSVSDTHLISKISGFYAEVEQLRLVSEADFMRWAYLQTISGGRLFEIESVRMAFSPDHSGRTPSEALDLIFDELIHRLPRIG